MASKAPERPPLATPPPTEAGSTQRRRLLWCAGALALAVLLGLAWAWLSPGVSSEARARTVAQRAVRAKLEPFACRFRERPDVGPPDEAADRVADALTAIEAGRSRRKGDLSDEESRLAAIACVYEDNDGDQPMWRTVYGTVDVTISGTPVQYAWEAWVTPTRREVRNVTKGHLRRQAAATPDEHPLPGQTKESHRRYIAGLVRGGGWDCPYVRLEAPPAEEDAGPGSRR